MSVGGRFLIEPNVLVRVICHVATARLRPSRATALSLHKVLQEPKVPDTGAWGVGGMAERLNPISWIMDSCDSKATNHHGWYEIMVLAVPPAKAVKLTWMADPLTHLYGEWPGIEQINLADYEQLDLNRIWKNRSLWEMPVEKTGGAPPPSVAWEEVSFWKGVINHPPVDRSTTSYITSNDS